MASVQRMGAAMYIGQTFSACVRWARNAMAAGAARMFCVAALIVFGPGSAWAKPADCLFEIDGQKLMDGPCQFLAHPGGSFTIVTLKGAGVEFIAEVDRRRSGTASGYWNGRPSFAKAQTPLGFLRPSGACWNNVRVHMCVWRQGEARYFVEAPPADGTGAAAANAGDRGRIPTRVGDCAQTVIAMLGSRLEGAPDSGSAISYANGLSGVSYETVAAVRASRVGDPVMLCLVSVPQDCPSGDDRGKVYAATNLRTKQGWSLPDSAHMCGGA